ncbi:MAG: alpha/beta hydrolase [Pseudomonadota bacterium]|nr:alpha/beta hydrolase [Pseudomonadota bacterium]
MAKQPKYVAPPIVVRTRRAYFDCRFGQIHVRTAFPTTGGFDEGVTLFCLHPSEGSSRTFARFLPEIADDRSAYAPDLPGCGESDAAPTGDYEDAAAAVSDLAADLRLRQIDVLGLRFGAGVALRLAVTRPELVRRLVLIGAPPIERLPVINQETLVLRVKLGAGDDSQWTKGVLPRAQFIDLTEYSPDLFDASPRTLAKQIGAFLKG